MLNTNNIGINQILPGDLMNPINKNYYTDEVHNLFLNSEDQKRYNKRDNNVQRSSQTKKKKLTDSLYEKICKYIDEIKEIDSVVPFCEEKNRKELLLDRGLLLCLKVNEIMDDCGMNFENILSYKKDRKIQIESKLLDENYWMNQKVDKYARTEQRKRIPQERWFMIKDNSFTPNLNKCFALNRGKFKDTYNWLNSLENK